VTNNSARVRIGYRIYSLWRFAAATQVAISANTLALVASQIMLMELHCADVSLRGHCDNCILLTPATNWRRLTHALIPETDWCRLTRALRCLPYITLGRPDRKLGRPTVGC
jgi:hypothetical protein